MSNTDLIPTALLARKAIVYVRQSSQSQVMTNLESQRRQYDLVDVARQHGFSKHRDHRRRPRALCQRNCRAPWFRPSCCPVMRWANWRRSYASMLHTLPRNGRDWHHLLELCAWSRPASLTMTASTIHAPQRSLLLGNEGQYQRVSNWAC